MQRLGSKSDMGSLPQRLAFHSHSCVSCVNWHLHDILKVEALACSLVARGFGAGDVIAVLLPNCVQVGAVSTYYSSKSFKSNVAQ